MTSLPTSPPAHDPPPTPSGPTDPMELWRVDDLVAFLPWGRSTVYQLTRQPWFPGARLLRGPRGTRRVWIAAEVRAWALGAPTSHDLTAAAPDATNDSDPSRATRLPEAPSAGSDMDRRA